MNTYLPVILVGGIVVIASSAFAWFLFRSGKAVSGTSLKDRLFKSVLLGLAAVLFWYAFTLYAFGMPSQGFTHVSPLEPAPSGLHTPTPPPSLPK